MLDVTAPPETEVVSKEKKIVRPYIDVEEIRKAYPNPKRRCNIFHRPRKGGYCVAGGFLKFVESDGARGFPTPIFELVDANPNLNAMPFANRWALVGRIWKRNDSGDFEGAWQALKEALEYGCDTSKEKA